MIHVDKNEHQCTVEGKAADIISEIALVIATTAASLSKVSDKSIDETLDYVVKFADAEARAVGIKFNKERFSKERE